MAIITNAGLAHVGEFGGPEKIVVPAKGEILEGLGEQGIAVLNLDKAFATWQARNGGRRHWSFAPAGPAADLHAAICGQDAMAVSALPWPRSPAGRARIQLNLLRQTTLPMPWRRRCRACPACRWSGIKAGLESLQPVKVRR